MANDAWTDMRYPIGKYRPPETIDEQQRTQWIGDLKELPRALRQTIADLDEQQLDTPYRENGWTVRQVVHHLPDSHLNSYIRFRLALTEDTPTIKPYREAAWAELKDAKTAPIELSLNLLESLHERWVILLRSMSEADFSRCFRHPELGEMTLAYSLGLYAWHGQHHLAQISGLRSRNGW